MKDIIIKELHNIENKYNIEILFSCESGSRAWGFPSPDSDYDVRFIYKHDLTWYLSIDSKKDVIEPSSKDLLDIGGWDIIKTLKLIKKSNPVIWEWLQSPIIYYNKDSFKEKLWQVSKNFYSLKASYYHYKSIASNIIKDHENINEIKIKKYFYILRPILSAFWICEKHEIPPMEFHILKNIISNQSLINEIDKLLEIKEKSVEKEKIQKSSILDDFVHKTIELCEERSLHLPVSTGNVEELNSFFREIII